MGRSGTFFNDLADGGNPVGHHPALPLSDVVVGVEEEVDGQLHRLGVQLLLLLRIATHWSAVGTCKLKKLKKFKTWRKWVCSIDMGHFESCILDFKSCVSPHKGMSSSPH